MDFAMFPFDTQNCELLMSSHHHIGEVEYVGRAIYDTQTQISHEFDYQFHAHKLNYSLDIDMGDKNETYFYSFVGFDITMNRKFKPYFYSFYIPVTGMVLTASMSFWIPPDVVPGRVALLITLSLVMISIFNNVQASNNIITRSQGFVYLTLSRADR